MNILFAQLLSQSAGGGIDDAINLDVHAISELQKRGEAPTNDLAKYNYTFNDKGEYCKLEVMLN